MDWSNQEKSKEMTIRGLDSQSLKEISYKNSPTKQETAMQQPSIFI